MLVKESDRSLSESGGTWPQHVEVCHKTVIVHYELGGYTTYCKDAGPSIIDCTCHLFFARTDDPPMKTPACKEMPSPVATRAIIINVNTSIDARRPNGRFSTTRLSRVRQPDRTNTPGDFDGLVRSHAGDDSMS